MVSRSNVWAAVAVLAFATVSGMSETIKHAYGVVLAGGSGERLWPLSRKNKPKQFLALGSEKTLLEQSIERLYTVIERDCVWLVTSENHKNRVEDVVGQSLGNLVVEPVGRNTGPAILLTCLQLCAHDPEAIVVFVPADAFIPQSSMRDVENALRKAIEFVSVHDVIALFGVMPTHAATGYGYIEYELENALSLPRVKSFHEKPSREIAARYIQKPNMLWNIGMFAARARVIIDEFKKNAPQLYDDVMAYAAHTKKYDALASISIDYAVIEKSDNVHVLPVSFSWCDVGNLEVFLSLKKQSQIMGGNAIEIDAHNNLVEVPNKLVALVGVDDLCVVETPDALLITKRSEAEKVRAVVAKLRQDKQYEFI